MASVVPHQHLDLLRGPALLDEQRRGRMPNGVEGEARLALIIDDLALEHQRLEEAMEEVGVPLDITSSVREDEVELALGAAQPPLAKCLGNERGHRDITPPCPALRRRQNAPTISTLADADDVLVKVDVRPAQPSHLRRPKPR